MKVIFLDFDGVIILPHSQGKSGSRSRADDRAVKHLNSIISRTRAKVVVSSAWRGRFKAPLKRLLQGWGVRCTVAGVTPRNRRRAWVYGPEDDLRQFNISGPRGAEIIAWLRGHPEVESFVILDDDSDMACVAHKLVKTDFMTGLTAEHEERAVRMLRGES
jgi:hypothetical protein